MFLASHWREKELKIPFDINYAKIILNNIIFTLQESQNIEYDINDDVIYKLTIRLLTYINIYMYNIIIFYISNYKFFYYLINFYY